jgi:hypothetical protein
MKQLKLGKKPARADAVEFRMSKYVDIAAWAYQLNLPRTFGHEQLVEKSDWGVLGNDDYGCCVFASMAHRHQLWSAIGRQPAKFTRDEVLRAYGEVTGFNPTDPSTDNGTDMGVAAKYNRRTGIRDEAGKAHTVEAYLAIDKGDIVQHYIAMRLFGLVDIGFNWPRQAWRQFERGKPWAWEKGMSFDGEGHCVPLVARRRSLQCVTWGRMQAMTVPFFEHCNDESIVYVETEMLTEGRSPEGFDAATLLADLAKLH